ncbi:hypothetical protein [Mesomycoplasma ovipneumoniae]|uniref:hypothetical protein n=1 Tax=Mesomycoplasma ovipneumoniae TaxID=29562 RepID=UPI002964F836|nr:hypothetical protein [Mesomycoplasma ovipneumoniae]
MFGLRKKYVIITLTKNKLINFDIELRGLDYVFFIKNQKMRIIHYIFKYAGMP